MSSRFGIKKRKRFKKKKKKFAREFLEVQVASECFGRDWSNCLPAAVICAGLIFCFFAFVSIMSAEQSALHQALDESCIFTSIPSENTLLASW
ncbi:hypothetical protein BDV27DRAFT_37652 [Aspergillus caelatus]|uniref:Uncharacterized protein n=1 Tax=Aspergillus caelatus TaxID=61420 RepID=A0A5N6ZUT2_9EURO|nr:uncharacterized protein BDV27DRAFT_37652 [Aspergillus caelatus]KAE8360676.1 hypothetical protein BDV27DRAFT_37652 [Aspergillus caelatus]